jgi:outer membrane protein TolC
MTAVQPIYTFGRISGLREAAEKGIEVSRAGVRLKSNDVTRQIKKLYYGILLAQDVVHLLDEVSRILQQGVEKTQRALEQHAKGADEKDLNTLKSFNAEAKKNRTDAHRALELASIAMAMLCGLDPTVPIALDKEGIEVTKAQIASEADAVAAALAQRPEMAQVRAGLRATEALVQVERGVYFPQFFLAAGGWYAYAGNREFQENPFVYDPLNDRVAEVVLGFRYTLDFGITRGRVRAARAEHEKVEAARAGAEIGIPIEVRKSLRDLDAAGKNIPVTEEGWHSARQWMVAASANYDIGVGTSWDLGEAAGLYARLKAEHYQALFDYEVALADFAYATGEERAR